MCACMSITTDHIKKKQPYHRVCCKCIQMRINVRSESGPQLQTECFMQQPALACLQLKNVTVVMSVECVSDSCHPVLLLNPQDWKMVSYNIFKINFKYLFKNVFKTWQATRLYDNII